MMKVITIVGIGAANLAAGVVLFVGLVALDITRALAVRAARGPYARLEPTAEQRAKFYAQLEEDEFRVLNVGPTVI